VAAAPRNGKRYSVELSSPKPGASDLAASPVSALAWRLETLQRREGLAHRLGADLGEDRLQREDAQRERIAVGVDCLAKQPLKRGRFFICQVKGHDL
jgi:hypothetical protein